jgi:hypothetical protein
VDDWLSGANSEENAFHMFEEARELMMQGGFPLVKWNSNLNILVEAVRDGSGGAKFLTTNGKVLGVQWDHAADGFVFGGVTVPSDLLLSKMTLLSLVARSFDPLDIVTPFIVSLKIIFQRVWQMGVSWDALLPEGIQCLGQEWLEDLEILKS